MIYSHFLAASCCMPERTRLSKNKCKRLEAFAMRNWQWFWPPQTFYCFARPSLPVILVNRTHCVNILMCLHVCTSVNSHFQISGFFIPNTASTFVNTSFWYAPLCQIANCQKYWAKCIFIRFPWESCLYTRERACSVQNDNVQCKSIQCGSVYTSICQISIIHVTNAKIFNVHQIEKKRISIIFK